MRSRTPSRSRPSPRSPSGRSRSAPTSSELDAALHEPPLRPQARPEPLLRPAMKALRLHGPGDLRLHDEPPPEPAAGEALLRIAAVGLCGSDRHWFTEGAIGDARSDAAARARTRVRRDDRVGSARRRTRGRRPGRRRAAAARSASRGSTISARTAASPATASPTGRCARCIAWPERLAYPIPDCRPGRRGVAARAARRCVARIRSRRRSTPRRRRACSAAGRSACCSCSCCAGPAPRCTPPIRWRTGWRRREALGATAEPREVDVAFEVAGTDAAVDAALAATRPAGRVVLVGIPDGDRTSFSASVARRKGLSLLLSRRMTQHDLPRAIGLVEAGSVALAGLVTERHGSGRLGATRSPG